MERKGPLFHALPHVSALHDLRRQASAVGIATPDLAEATPDQWRRFIADGRQDGEFRLLSLDGTQVAVRFQAGAHHPIPAYDTSRSWPVDPPAS